MAKRLPWSSTCSTKFSLKSALTRHLIGREDITQRPCQPALSPEPVGENMQAPVLWGLDSYNASLLLWVDAAGCEVGLVFLRDVAASEGRQRTCNNNSFRELMKAARPGALHTNPPALGVHAVSGLFQLKLSKRMSLLLLLKHMRLARTRRLSSFFITYGAFCPPDRDAEPHYPPTKRARMLDRVRSTHSAEEQQSHRCAISACVPADVGASDREHWWKSNTIQ